LNLRIRYTIAPLLSIVFHLILHCWIPLFNAHLLLYNSHPITLLVFEKKCKKLNGVFKFSAKHSAKFVWRKYIYPEDKTCGSNKMAFPLISTEMRRYLDTVYANKCTVRGSINLWPPRTPDITPLDYFLLGMVKERVYQTPINSREDLEYRITFACTGLFTRGVFLNFFLPQPIIHIAQSLDFKF
jgi:hypothetical protein